MNYTFAQSEGYGTVGENLTRYITVEHPDTNLLVIGSRGLDGLIKVNNAPYDACYLCSQIAHVRHYVRDD